MTALAFVDTETTGLLPHHEVWEVGMVLRSDVMGDCHDYEYVWQLPVEIERADPKALEINRYHERRWHADRFTRLDKFAMEFTALTKGAVLVVNNVAFDVPLLDRMLRNQTYVPLWHYHPQDMQSLMAGYLQGLAVVSQTDWLAPGPPPWSGSALAKQFVDTPPEDLHTALGDARWMRDVWDCVFR